MWRAPACYEKDCITSDNFGRTSLPKKRGMKKKVCNFFCLC